MVKLRVLRVQFDHIAVGRWKEHAVYFWLVSALDRRNDKLLAFKVFLHNQLALVQVAKQIGMALALIVGKIPAATTVSEVAKAADVAKYSTAGS